MKKRAKIITTIASLCLAVALMAFGVYAATSVSLTVTSKVSFTVRDVFVDVSGAFTVKDRTGEGFSGSAGAWVNPDDSTDAYWSNESGEATTFSAVSYQGTIGTDVTPADTLVVDASTNTQHDTWDAGTALLDSTVTGAKYVITIVNRSTTTEVYVTADKIAALGANATSAANTITQTYAITNATGNDLHAGNIAYKAETTTPGFLPTKDGANNTWGAYLKLAAGATLTLTYQIEFNDYTRALAETTLLNGVVYTIQNSAPTGSGDANTVATSELTE